jgi:hypothetical protein
MLQLIKIGLKGLAILMLFLFFLNGFLSFFLGIGWGVIALISKSGFSVDNGVVLGAVVLRFLFIISVYFHLVKVWKIEIWIAFLSVPLIDVFFYYLGLSALYFQKLKLVLDGGKEGVKKEYGNLLTDTLSEVQLFSEKHIILEEFTADFSGMKEEVFNSFVFYILVTLLFVLFSYYKRSKKLYLENKI